MLMNQTLKTYLRYTSWPIILAMVTLMAIGIIAIDVSEQADSQSGYAARQVVWAAVGIAVFVVMTVIPYPRIGQYAYVLFFITMLMLVIVFVPTPLTAPRKGAHRWIGLQELSVQPSEIAKLTYIILLAWYLRYRDNYRRLGGLIIPFVLTLVPAVLILKEPDLGTSLLFLPTLYFMLFMAGAKLRHLLVILGLGTVFVLLPVSRQVEEPPEPRQFDTSHVGPITFYSVKDDVEPSARPYTPVAYCRYQFGDGPVSDLQPLSLRIMKDHQIRRIEGWLRQDDADIIKDKGYQLHQSKLILGSGCVTGRKGWNDSDMYFRLLPDDHTDFIFSVVGGQWGFLGCMAVLFLYGVIFVFGVEIAVITDDPFGRLLAVGVLALLFSQIFINAGMAMGLMPVTGMTLPFVSYGGSSLLINAAAMGLLINVGQRRPISLAPKPFEYRD